MSSGVTTTSPLSAVAQYALLASAIAGRAVDVRPAGTDPAHTDGTTVFVPDQVPPHRIPHLIALHAGLLAIGADQPNVLRRLTARTTGRYFALEAARAGAELDRLLPAHMLDFGTVNAVTSSAVQSFSIAQGPSEIALLDRRWGELRPRTLAAHTLKAEPPAATEDRAPRQQTPAGLEEELEDDEETERSHLLRLMTSPLGKDTWASKLFNSLAGTKKKTTPTPGSPTEAMVTRHIYGRRLHGRGVTVGTRAPAGATGAGPGTGEGLRYPEWDTFRSSYRDDWCTVRELPVATGTGTIPDQSLLRQPLGRIRLDLRRSRHETIGDDLDLDAVVAARSDIRTGRQPDDHLYTSMRRLQRDLAVLILVDVSGSTDDPARGSAGSVLDAQLAAAARLARSLEARGDRVALYGFNSRGRSDVYLYRVKEFGQHSDTRWLHKLSHLEPAGFTRMGAAVRHGVSILTERSGAAREILLVLSDGLPFDDGYEGRYASADTKRALAEARQSGVGCLCLSLGAGQDARALERVFGSAAFGGADDITHYGSRLNTLFNEALLAAERSHRRGQLQGKGRHEHTR